MSKMGHSRRTSAATAWPDVRFTSKSGQTSAPQRNAALCHFRTCSLPTYLRFPSEETLALRGSRC